ncbi:MAG: cytochrome C [Deltaproteobacteria bacterium RIFOXYD12_FULL_57_12]|nr:MAG: cytochrome C [Deltaproteobacteria bacterium RIFOXYD12_FULL_57_12]
MVTPPKLCRAEEVDARRGYVGSAACMDCHADEYLSFMTYAKKSRSFESIEKLKKGLTAEEIAKCYFCHTTGYGKPGGFVSVEETPHLQNAGCEVCHGPGLLHARTTAPADIKKHLTTEDCEACHTSERVKAFRYKPMIHGGAH